MAQKFATYHRKNFTHRFCTAKLSRRTHSNGGCHDGMRWLLGEYPLLPPTLVGKKTAGNAVRVASWLRPGVARFQCTGWPGSFCSRVSSINSMGYLALYSLCGSILLLLGIKWSGLSTAGCALPAIDRFKEIFKNRSAGRSAYAGLSCAPRRNSLQVSSILRQRKN